MSLKNNFMYPILFSIGNIHFYSYGLMAALAFIAGFLVIEELYRFKHLDDNKLIDKYLIVIIFSIVFSRLAFFIVYYSHFSEWYEVFFIWNGGLISYGGMIGALLVILWKFRNNLRQNLDIISIGFLLGTFFWRIGCTLSDEHPTVVSNNWLNIQDHIPVPLFESISGLIGFIIAYYIYKKYKLIAGRMFSYIIIYYGLIRLIFDQWRIDDKIGTLTVGQISGLVLIWLGLVTIIGLSISDKVYKNH